MLPQGGSPNLAITIAFDQDESSKKTFCQFALSVLDTRQFRPVRTTTLVLSCSSIASAPVRPAGFCETGAFEFSARTAMTFVPGRKWDTTSTRAGMCQFAPAAIRSPFNQAAKRSSAAICKDPARTAELDSTKVVRKNRESIGASLFGSPSGYQIQSPSEEAPEASAQVAVFGIGFSCVQGNASRNFFPYDTSCDPGNRIACSHVITP